MLIETVITPKYQIGDVVRLKSGGPFMTVSWIIYDLNLRTGNNDIYKGMVYCQWFEDHSLDDTPRLREAKFREELLSSS